MSLPALSLLPFPFSCLSSQSRHFNQIDQTNQIDQQTLSMSDLPCHAERV